MVRQRTVVRPASLHGVGVHTGEPSTLTLLPAAPGTGFCFVRVDLPGRPRIGATVDLVRTTERGTSLGKGSAVVHTVEHVLAALAGCQIDNATIEVSGSEVPFADGSSLPFAQLIEEAGVSEQEAPRSKVGLSGPVALEQGGVVLAALPANSLRLSFTLDFSHSFVQSQFLSWELSAETFVHEIAPARSFCFVRDVEELRQRGLIRGGSLKNAVVIGEEGILNREPLRFPDEFVRHKIADLLGDLVLLGCPLAAHVISVKSGHPTNIAFVHRLRQVLFPGKE
jgi:UDP-3-O-[3-hydroxymyristoyl] N-acetylglucosamine deacetylase/3-hydroxyacyl-[acyl-carrier-protein] dehydratase